MPRGWFAYSLHKDALEFFLYCCYYLANLKLFVSVYIACVYGTGRNEVKNVWENRVGCTRPFKSHGFHVLCRKPTLSNAIHYNAVTITVRIREFLFFSINEQRRRNGSSPTSPPLSRSHLVVASITVWMHVRITTHRHPMTMNFYKSVQVKWQYRVKQ